MNVKEIEEAILHLSPKELSKLTDWLVEHRAKSWDAEIEQDLESGKLDKLLDEVDKEYAAGLATFL
ncbi:hypothetical protein GlitD10_2420 [Gloeomargarita lithophora Alchichica-D10]|uniref:DUF2281 domain-containing protein n=1 Tax=Gloeomargarita lithophora Alchichica-D10 TaxID=1188229 RepID=A0A1J0AFP6_9CYAN|nr:hypothetical protein [Gloeomargarita lithophora]APB34754.1 hypothetical protein GlitD10_2420 [Gloeomargarita lithophora Alchichica-D10]